MKNFFGYRVMPAAAGVVVLSALGALAAPRPEAGPRAASTAGASAPIPATSVVEPAGRIVIQDPAPAAATAPDMSWTKLIRRTHPRLYFTDESWPDVRRRALTVQADWYARVKAIARSADGEDWLKIKRPGPLPGSVFDVYDWGARIFAAAFVQRMEPDRARLAEIKALLRASLAYYRAAYDQGREAAWYSLSRAGCFAALDWLWDDFTAAERREIGGGLLAHVREALHKPGILYRNENGVKTGNYGVDNFCWFAGLALFGEGIDDAAAEEALRRGYEVYVKMFEHRAAAAGDDGGGASATLGYLVGEYPNAEWNFLHTWRSAVGEDLAGRPPFDYAARLPVYILWNWLPGDHEFGSGDVGHLTNRLPIGQLFAHMTQAEALFARPHPELAALAGRLRARVGGTLETSWIVHPFLVEEPEKTPGPAAADGLPGGIPGPAPDPLARHFDGMGQVIFRSGGGAADTYALFMGGGRLDQHRHLDAGHFTIFHRGFLALDTGTRDGNTDNLQNYFAQTEAHNCVMIKMPGEPPVPYWNGEVYGNGGGQDKVLGSRIAAFETKDGYAYAAVDATPVYRPEKCESAIRQFVFIPPHHFVVFDRVTAAKAEYGKRWLLHHANRPVLLDGRTWRADQAEGRIFCRTLLPEDAVIEAVGGPGREFLADGRNYPIDAGPSQERLRNAFPLPRPVYAEVPELMGRWRVEVKPGAARREDVFLHLLEVGSGGLKEMAPAAVRRVGDAVELRFEPGAKTVTILFATRGAAAADIRIAPFLLRRGGPQ